MSSVFIKFLYIFILKLYKNAPVRQIINTPKANAHV